MSCQQPIPGLSFSPEPGIHALILKISDILERDLPRAVSPDYRGMRHLEFHPDDFSRDVFSEKEILSLNRFRALKKQVEWISGRIALKSLVNRVIRPDLPMNQLDVSYREKGAPFITSLPQVPISLSHSGNYTAAVLSEDPGQVLGIDLERIGPCPGSGFLETAFSPREIRRMEVRAQDIFRNWTLKEAFLKYIQMGFNESLHRVEIINGRIFHNGRLQDIRSWSQILEKEYMLSLVWRSISQKQRNK